MRGEVGVKTRRRGASQFTSPRLCARRKDTRQQSSAHILPHACAPLLTLQELLALKADGGSAEPREAVAALGTPCLAQAAGSRTPDW